MYRRLSEARNLACIRRYGLQTSEVPAPASPPASAFGTFPAPTRGQVSRPDPHHTPMPSDSGSSRLNRAPICSGAGCLDWGSVRPGALRQWGLAALWRPCIVCPGGLFRRLPSGLPPARKPRAAAPSAHGSISTPPFFVEKTAGSSAWSSDMVGRTAWVPPDGQTAPPATIKLESPSNLTRRGCTKTCLFWPAETTNLSHHSLLAPCGLCRDRFPRLSPARSPTDLILPDRSTRLTMVFGFLSLLFHRADSLQQLRQTWARF